ncbi:MAG: hypothetical protein CTY40_01960 [Hyphomicrobium sp.]|nr:MAG: hypothetical protein CTY40_01960 [Hyphomicrobium sp.]
MDSLVASVPYRMERHRDSILERLYFISAIAQQHMGTRNLLVWRFRTDDQENRTGINVVEKVLARAV